MTTHTYVLLHYAVIAWYERRTNDVKKRGHHEAFPMKREKFLWRDFTPNA